MLREEANSMEKLYARSLNLGSDSKGKQDVGNKFPRSNGNNGRCSRRESSSSSSYPNPKPEAYPSKPWLQRQGGYEKRQAAAQKGAGVTSLPTQSRNGCQVAVVQKAEIGSATRPGAKKQNLNHLLNFTYDRREVTTRGSHYGVRNNNIWATKKHRYNKEQFLQANCQFIVSEGNNYRVHAADPDLLVDWEWIEQIRVPGHEVPSCPICLYPPVAAKMTRCGHIYCWPCILHYLALTDDSWRKCPICYEAIHKTDLKSVVSLATPCFNVGDVITMQLMRRERGSVMALPSSRFVTSDDGAPFLLDSGADSCYAKLLLANRKQVLDDVIDREEVELNVALEMGKESPEVCFVESALQQLKVRKEKLLEMIEREIVSSAVKTEEVLAVASERKDGVVKEIFYGSAFSDEEIEAGVFASNMDSCSNASDSKITKESEVQAVASVPQRDKGAYYFYQAVDGQLIYVRSLNIQMLVREYGSLDKSPDVITATIIEKEGITMNEELRGRLGYLRHLPLTCEFELVELQLNPPIVSRETITEFAGEIAKRSERRSRRARDERRRERLIKVEENKRKEPFAGTGLRLDSLQHFPECVPSDDGQGSSPNDGEVAACLAGSSPSSLPEGGHGVSFAQMLRDGKSRPDIHPVTWPDIGGAVGFGGRRREKADRDVFRYGSDSDFEDSIRAPTFRDSFSADLRAALDVSCPSSPVGDDSEGVRKKKKKKGKQKRLLFTTNVAFHN